MAIIHPLPGEFREHCWILQQVQKALQDKKFSLSVIFPTLSLLGQIQNELLDQPEVDGLGGIRFLLFEGFIEEISERFGLGESDPAPLIKDLLLTEAFESLKAQGKLGYLARAPFNDGYREAVLAGIAEWKRSRLTPETFIRWASSHGEKEQQLAVLYQSYQALLVQNGFYEEDGILQKLQVLQSQGESPSERPLVILYGFTDLTPLQNQFIEVLSAWFDFEIILDPTPVEEIRQFIACRFGCASLPEIRTVAGDNVLRHLQDHYGETEREAYAKAGDDDSVQILQTAGSTKENMVIAGQIVTLLQKNSEYCLDDFLILSPHPQDFIQTARPVFAEYGLTLPPSSVAVSEYPGSRCFSQALAVADADWQWPDMEALIRQQYVGNKAGDGDRILVELGERYGALSGKERWLGLYQKDFLSYFLEKGLDIAPLQRGVNLLECIPERARLKEYLTMAGRYLKDAWKEAIGRSVTGEIDFSLQQSNLNAMQQTSEIIKEMMVVIEFLPSFQEEMRLADFRTFWAHLTATEIKTKSFSGSWVRVLIPKEARGLSARFVFITGLEQGSFPRYYVNDWKLSLRERLELQALGVDLETGEEYQTKEKMAFYWALQTAKEKLFLVYQTQDHGGQQLNPSPFLEEIGQLCPELLREAKTYSLAMEAPESLTGCHSFFEKGSFLAAHLLAATAELTETEKADCRKLLQKPRYQRLAEQIRQESSGRMGRNPLFTKPESRQMVARIFGVQHTLAITALEEYISCPYRFFLKQLLGVKPFFQPQMLPDHLDLGNLYHQVLQEFAETYRGESLLARSREEYVKRLQECFHDYYREWLQNAANDLVKLVLKLQETQIRSILLRWLQNELDWAEQTHGRFVIDFLEFGFGLVRGDFDPASQARPYRLESEGVSVQIWGKVDRIDRDEDGNFVVYDYKSGRGPATKEILQTEYYQLPVYIMALEDLHYGNGKAAGGSYLGLKEPSRSRGGVWRQDRLGLKMGGKGLLPEKDWQDWLQTVKSSLTSSVQAIRSGEFFPTLAECPVFCEFKSCCRCREREVLENDEISAE